MTTVGCGHCNNQKLTLTQKRKRFCAKHCEHWESNEAEKETRRESLETVLYQLSEQLSSIAALLGKNNL